MLTVKVNGAGLYEIQWDGLDQSGAAVSSGFYVYIVELRDQILAGKMELIQ